MTVVFLYVDFFDLSYLKVSFLNLYVYVFCKIWKILSQYFFILLQSYLSLLWDSSDMNVRYFYDVPLLLKVLFIFIAVYFLSFIQIG